MKVLEVTDPNFVVNKDFIFIDTDGTSIPFYEDDYLNIEKLSDSDKLVINGKYVVDNPDDGTHILSDYIEPVTPTSRVTESKVSKTSLLEAKIILG